MKEKAQKWIDRAKSGRLHRRNFWFLIDKQFWSGGSFGISSFTATLEELEECMIKIYYDFLLVSGMRRSVNRELRQMDREFDGCGLPHPVVSVVVIVVVGVVVGVYHKIVGR